MKQRLVDPRVTWAVNYMQLRMCDPLSMPTLASSVNLSPSRFHRLFTAQTGMAPSRYLQHLRLRRARLLIERTCLSVKEVMALVGYNDASDFASDFRRHHGLAPSSLCGRDAATPMPRGGLIGESADVQANRPTLPA